MKSEKKRSKKSLAVVLTVIMVLSVCAAGIVPVSATEVSVIRSLPVSVGTEEEFDVTLTQDGFGMTGLVNETLPEGFGYVVGSYTGSGTVSWNPATRDLGMWFVEPDISVTYRVTASSYEQTAVFSGIFATFVLPEGFIPGVVEGDPEVGVDGTPPYTDGHNPAKGATGVPVDTNIVVHVKDNYVVDPNSIVMTVQYSSVTPTKTVLGLDHWLVTYNPPVDFGSVVTVVVTIDASDMAGNAMPQDVYSFTTEGEGDTDPPAAISNLATSNPTSSSITLTWTAPGDNGNTGTATTYDIRYLEGTTQITEANWASATQCDGEPAPQPAGSSETFTVTGLSPSTTYYFALKTADEVPLWSTVSNSPSETTTTPTYPDWDINEDGIINYLDAAYIGIHYGETTGEPYPRWDINEDGIINYLDAAYIGIHYGEVSP